jgi:hypothetical protein
MMFSSFDEEGNAGAAIFTHEQVPGTVVPNTAIIRCHPPGWAWEVTRDDFEVIHGLSRIVRMMPSQLATAVAVQWETGEGAFFCDLIKDLLEKFRDIHSRGQLIRTSPRIEDLKTLGEVLSLCFEKLQTISGMMQASEGDFLAEIQNVLELADNIRKLASIFLGYVFPLLTRLNKGVAASPEEIQTFQERCETEIRRLNKLQDEFNSLIAATRGPNNDADRTGQGAGPGSEEPGQQSEGK